MQDSRLRNSSHSILSFDQAHIWHPYASANPEKECLLVEKANGVYIHLESGEKLIDGMSSWWSVIHGYNHPELNAALAEQSHKMAHIMFGGLTHRPAVELAQQLLRMVPKGLEHIFYSDSGSVAVEVAMKMALQYWHSKNEAGKNQFLSIKKGYHGDTWHAMSVCDPVTGMHHIFNNKLSVQHFLPSPNSKFDGDFIEKEMDEVDFPQSLNVILSSSTIQWFKNKKRFFDKVHQNLKSNGLFAFSTFGCDNFREIRSLIGVGLEYHSLNELSEMLSDQFNILMCDEWVETKLFDSPLHVLRHIKQTGVNAIQQTYFGKKELKDFTEGYYKHFSTSENQFSLSYNPIIIIAQKK